jgi:hypothetical protein
MTNESATDEIVKEVVVDDADALEMLKAKAETLGVSYSNRIGVDALRAKIADHIASTEAPAPSIDESAGDMSIPKMRAAMKAREMKLIRLRITNMNESKSDLDGEIFCVMNKYLGIVKRFVPYGEKTDEGWHVPYVIYKQLRDRKFLQIKTKTVKGQIQVDTRWVKEFNLEIMDPLTETELKQLVTAQAAAAGL